MDQRRREGATIARPLVPPWASLLIGVTILALLAGQLGARPFREAGAGIGVSTVAAALALNAAATWCCARRWALVCARLGVAVRPVAAYRAYYRAQLLNVTLPSGIIGEVDRAVWHGHHTRAMSAGVRSVVWDRVIGQAVLLGLTVLALPLLDPPLRTWLAWLGLGVAAAVLVALRFRANLMRAVWSDLRRVLGGPGLWWSVVTWSVLATAGHLAIFVVAARSVGVTVPLPELVALGLVVLQAAAIPLAAAGWGPREGGAALVFGAAGLGADAGLASAVAFGVLITLAALPGVLALRRRTPSAPEVKGDSSWVSAPTRS